ncbi:DUF4398 domain-containing protein [Candidatus Methylocalor cossyra]|uniref:DUF4398 domain-containing protein n=1 Tax=Candidatus Methylocalor cossyra TaxID=3108543 RepID=A0ABM9NIP5_9GAMM
MAKPRKHLPRLVGSPWLTALLAGCAGNPPIDTIAGADAALNQALAAEASQFAPTELQHALDEMNRAKQALKEEDYTKARRLAEAAQVDAQVAEAKARAEQAAQTATQERSGPAAAGGMDHDR